jgi:type II secretory pathway predicted ATPase ExeA
MYEAYFGLADLPFRIAPDPRFYVDTATHRGAIRALQDRLGQGAEFVPLIGDFGTGKTTVGRQLLAEIDRTRQVAAELPRTRIEGDQLLDRVAAAFGLRRAKGLAPLESAIRQFEGLVREGREALLLVDDAHQLDAAVLRRLRKLTAVRVDGRAALRVCLAGRSTPGFEELQRFGHPPSVGTPVRLDALDAAGTHTYILERLRRAGWHGRPAFESATAAIHGRCKGNPARINRLCGHILLHLYMQGRDDVNVNVVRAVDDLLQAELRGEPATLALPPLAHVTPCAGTQAPRYPALYGEALMTRLIARTLSPTPPPDSTVAAPPPEAASTVQGVEPRHHRLAQGVTALALMATGGFLWQTISNLAAARGESTRRATEATSSVVAAAPPQTSSSGQPALTPQATPDRPMPTAAGLAAMAERTLERSPPAASAPAGRVSGKD